MPYVIEHAARVREPEEFREDTMRRKPLIRVVVVKGKGGKPRKKKILTGVRIVIGKLKGGGTSMVDQAYRFDKTKFTPAQAKAWLKKEGIVYIKFEPAKKEYAKGK